MGDTNYNSHCWDTYKSSHCESEWVLIYHASAGLVVVTIQIFGFKTFKTCRFKIFKPKCVQHVKKCKIELKRLLIIIYMYILNE